MRKTKQCYCTIFWRRITTANKQNKPTSRKTAKRNGRRNEPINTTTKKGRRKTKQTIRKMGKW